MNKIVTIAVLCYLSASSINLLAAEPHVTDATSEIKNSGFEKNPPAALKQKFPMCNEFVKVKWISKERQIGYSEFETPLKNKQGKSIGKGKVSVLVMMKGDPDMWYEVSYFKEEGTLEKLFDALRNGEISAGWGGTGYDVSYLSDNFHLNFAVGPNESDFEPVLSGYQQTVCVVYPDGRRAWISEGKRLDKIYDQAQLDSLLGDLKSAGAELDRYQLNQSWMLDINGDGIPDYVDFSHRGFVTYSSGREQYKTSVLNATKAPSRNTTDRNTRHALPLDYRKCTAKLADSKYITTDGKNYYFNNRCNLTKGTSQESNY